MFLKAYRVKSSERLKGSDVKRLRLRLEKDYPSSNCDVLLPAKACVQRLKIFTHCGTQTFVYCLDKLPMFFELEGDILVPTIYAMWSEPNMLPYFSTFEAVLPKLTNGAHLMLPGLVPIGTGMNMYGHFKKGALVAINLTNNKAAVAVGTLARSSDDLYMCGGQGVAVKILHLFGDKLWGHDPSVAQQLPLIKPPQISDVDFPALGAEPKKQKKIDEVSSAASPNFLNSSNENDTLVKMSELNLKTESENLSAEKIMNNDENNENDTLSTPEVILKNAFLAALKNHGSKLPLPILTSNFFRTYVVPESTEQLDLKKTRYKKLSNFLNEMSNEGFIVLREESKGIDKITEVDLQHPEVVNFIMDINRGENNGIAHEQPLFHSELTALYVVTDATAPFFTKMNFKRGEGIPATQIRKIVREYISKYNLPSDPTTKKITLDETLAELSQSTEATLSETCGAIINNMDCSFQMCSGKDTSNNKPLIQMSLATRSGNKKVTLVSNVDCYGIILSEFIKLCKQGAAASTNIVKVPNQKREHLQIQGNQIKFVYNLLTETYKVPPKCILGLELAKEGRKHKKK